MNQGKQSGALVATFAALALSAFAGAPTLPHSPQPPDGSSGLPQALSLAWQFAPPASECGTLYAAAKPATAGTIGESSLYILNPDTGAETLVGPIGFRGVSGLTFGPDGVLYGSAAGEASPGQDPRVSILIRINPATGAGALIGTIGSAANPGSPGRISDLTTSPSGQLFGISPNVGGTDRLALYRINPATAAAGLIGFLDPGKDYFCCPSLDFTPVGALLAAIYTSPGPRLFTLDPATAAHTPGPLLFPSNDSTVVSALEHCPATGTLYGASSDFSGTIPIHRLLTINPNNGASSSVPAVEGLDALAFDPTIVTYDVYLDANNPPTTLVCDDTPSLSCDVGPLQRCSTYYWRVVATINEQPIVGPVWSFETGYFSIGDTDGDGDVDFTDLNNVLADYGGGPDCPSPR